MAHGGLAMLLVGMGFKIALVPFHAWAPDVYQGAPTPVTALLSVGSKAAGFAGLVRLLLEPFAPLGNWSPALGLLAALTLVVGSCVAMLQEDIKRLIAYSGVAHVGFLLMGLVAHGRLAGAAGASTGAGLDSEVLAQPAMAGVVFYVVAYALMTLGALSVVGIVERDYGRRTLILDYAGLASRRPVAAASMLAFMLSLGGMPPLAGFVGKWLVFQAALSAGLVWLAVLGALVSVVGFYFYLRVVLQMYLRPARPDAADAEMESAAGPWALAGATAVASVLLGLFPYVALRLLETPGPLVAVAAP
jgi:NADH-quinone oxidoreductase subunit N